MEDDSEGAVILLGRDGSSAMTPMTTLREAVRALRSCLYWQEQGGFWQTKRGMTTEAILAVDAALAAEELANPANPAPVERRVSTEQAREYQDSLVPIYHWRPEYQTRHGAMVAFTVGDLCTDLLTERAANEGLRWERDKLQRSEK